MIITQAPLRVSFFGGGSDFPEHYSRYGGAVLNTAIDQFSYVAVQPFNHQFFDHPLRISYRKAEAPKSTSEIENPAIRACLEKLGINCGIELHHMSDLPARTGLGSSSSFVVAMLQALHAHCGRFRSPESLAGEAIEVERVILGESGGHQDQIVAAFGGINFIRFHGMSNFDVSRVPLSAERIEELESHMVLAYTSIERYSFTALDSQPSNVSSRERARRELSAMAEDGFRILTGNSPIAEFGRLLHQGWECKRSCGGVSLPLIDEIYEKGLSAGAVGGKLLGAGQGGFLLFIVPPSKQNDLATALGEKNLVRVRINATGSRVIFSQK
jgi:D-glycero-alpha-D-manno-heptose-7-phosphate kinase